MINSTLQNTTQQQQNHDKKAELEKKKNETSLVPHQACSYIFGNVMSI